LKLVNLIQRRLDRSLLAKTQVQREEQLRLDFSERSLCVRQELKKFTGAMPRLPFGDIRRN